MSNDMQTPEKRTRGVAVEPVQEFMDRLVRSGAGFDFAVQEGYRYALARQTDVDLSINMERSTVIAEHAAKRAGIHSSQLRDMREGKSSR